MDSYFFRFRLRGLVQPGWIFSNVLRQRESFSVMDSTVAVHTNGFGSLFQAVRNASMDAFRSSTLRNTSALSKTDPPVLSKSDPGVLS